MSNSKKLIIFLTAFFATLSFIILMSTLFGQVLQYNSQITDLSLKTITFIVFVSIQGFLRQKTLDKMMKDAKVDRKIACPKFTLNQKSWLYFVIILIYYLPAIKDRNLAYLNAFSIGLSIVSLVLVELLLRWSNQTTFIYFTDKGLFINGMDLRLMVPVIYGGQLFNDSNLYTYDQLFSYIHLGEQIDIEDNYRRKIITIKESPDNLKQIEGLLKRKNIKAKKLHG